MDMTSVCVAVEWGFKEVKQVYTGQDFKRKLKIKVGLVAQPYRAAMFLWNNRCCLYGGQTSTFFKCTHQRVERYLSVLYRTTVRKTVG